MKEILETLTLACKQIHDSDEYSEVNKIEFIDALCELEINMKEKVV